MNSPFLLAVCAALTMSATPVLAQDAAAPGAGGETTEITTEAKTTHDSPVSVEIAIGGLSDDAKFSAATSAAETATMAHIIYVSELQTGPTNATVEQLRQMAAKKEELLKILREKLGANTALSEMLEEQGATEHIVSAALDQDGTLLIFVDDDHEM